MAHTETRDTLFKWVGPISTSSVLLVAKNKHAKKIEIKKLDQLDAYRVGVIRSDAGEQMLLSKKVPSSIMVKSVNLQGIISNLAADRVDVICIGAQAFKKLEEQSPSDTYYEVMTVAKNEDYFAFSKDVPDELIRKFQDALIAIRPRHLKLLDSLGLSLDKKYH